MTIRQIKNTKLATIRSVLHSKAFMMGFSDVREGRPFRYDHFTNQNDQWNYERGRIYASASQAPVKIQGRVHPLACQLAAQMMAQGVLL
jgi:hypothetical protein